MSFVANIHGEVMKLEDIEILKMDLDHHIHLLEYLAYEMEEGEEDIKLFAYILRLSGSYLEKAVEKMKTCLESEWEQPAQKRLAETEGKGSICEVEYKWPWKLKSQSIAGSDFGEIRCLCETCFSAALVVHGKYYCREIP